MSIKKFEDYYLGLDLGTTSIGWAATTLDYDLLHLRRKPAIGVHLFEEAQTKKTRRTYRSVRRRQERRKKRILLLQSLFAEELAKVDPTFFLRLNNSAYFQKDKDRMLKNTKSSLFHDPQYKDKDFFKTYPTIYHLQKDIIFNPQKKFDIRHIYLAIHHLIKYRGNFIREDETLNIDKFTEELANDSFEAIYEYVNDNDYLAGIDFFAKGNLARYKKIINDKTIGGMTRTAEAIFEEFAIKDRYLKMMINLSLGKAVRLNQLFNEDVVDKEQGKHSLDFKKDTFDDDYLVAQSLIGEEHIVLIDELKNLYDYFTITRLMGGKKFVSEAMVDKYKKHEKDLRFLKDILIKHASKEQYREVFTILYTTDEKGKKKAIDFYNYPRYIGKKHNEVNLGHKDYSEFAKYIKSVFKKLEIEHLPEVAKITQELDDRNFLPRLNTKDNATIPYQFNEYQLMLILNQQGKHYPFLLNKEGDDLSVADKIMHIIRFRIPYYVGPLVEEKDHPYAWVKRRSMEKVTPWNFDKVIDKAASAERFITRMTNKCSYIPTEDVLPKESLLYEKYDVLNRLNSIKVNGARLDNHATQKIFEYLYNNRSALTKKKLIALLTKHKNDVVDLEKFQDDEKLALPSYHKFKAVLKDEHKLSTDTMEQIIFYRTIFTDKAMYEKKLKELVKDKVPAEVLDGLKKLKFSGWGRFSAAFLTGFSKTLNKPILTNEKTGEVISIIEIMSEERLVLQEILFSGQYNLNKIIDDYNDAFVNRDLSLVEMVDASYLSPGVKRTVLKSMYIIDEVIKANGGISPKKIFLEVTRSDEAAKKGKKTDSRKEQLIKLYKKVAKKEALELKNIIDGLNNTKDTDLKSRKLFLYYLQHGRCLYSGRPIKLEELATGNYDIEHIIPQSTKTDNSLNNICLIEKEINARKGDTYPLPRDIIDVEKMKPFWLSLKEKGFMSDQKYQSLIRVTPLTEKEKLEFINRQLVETSQANKMVAELIKQRYGDIVVYSKAQNVSEFRNKFNLIKLRDLNKAHHAHDAYLNIIVGNYYDAKTRYVARKVKANEDFTYNLSKTFEEDKYDTVWYKKEHLKKIHDVFARKNILFTRDARLSTGEFYDQNLSSASEGKLNKLKAEGPLSDTTKYGGYSNSKNSHFVIADVKKNKKITRRILAVPRIEHELIKQGKRTLEDYLIEEFEADSIKVIRDLLPIGFLVKRGKTIRTITGKSGSNIVAHNINEPLFDKDIEKGFYLLNRYLNIVREEREDVLGELEGFTIFIGNKENGKRNPVQINRDSNLKLFNKLISHYKKDIYEHIFGDLPTLFEEGKDIFNNMAFHNQVTTLLQMIELLQTGPLNRSINLSEFGVNKSIAMNFISNEVLEGDRVLLQSITGLYEKEVVVG